MQTNNSQNAEDVGKIIDRMKKAINADQDSELTKYLGLAKSTISTWKGRGKKPYAECELIAGRENISLHWLITGQGEMHLSPATETASEHPKLCKRQEAALTMLKQLPEAEQDKSLDKLAEMVNERLEQIEMQKELERLKRKVG